MADEAKKSGSGDFDWLLDLIKNLSGGSSQEKAAQTAPQPQTQSAGGGSPVVIVHAPSAAPAQSASAPPEKPAKSAEPAAPAQQGTQGAPQGQAAGTGLPQGQPQMGDFKPLGNVVPLTPPVAQMPSAIALSGMDSGSLSQQMFSQLLASRTGTGGGQGGGQNMMNFLTGSGDKGEGGGAAKAIAGIGKILAMLG